MKKKKSYKWIPISILIFVGVCTLDLIVVNFFRERKEQLMHGNYAYELTSMDLTILVPRAENGDCDAAYRVGRHHLYVSLDYVLAEKFLRIASVCPNVDAKLGLVTVLRQPEHDAEVDRILHSIEELDKQAWHDATIEVARRKGYRKQK